MTSIRLCPVCSGHFREKLHRQNFLEGVLGAGYDVVVCKHCGAGFADGIPSQEELDVYYEQQSKYTYDSMGGTESIYDRHRFEITADQLGGVLRKDSRVLEIGCATGGLLAVLRSRGFSKVLGADPSPTCAKLAKNLYDIDVAVATLKQLSGWTERFDMIVMIGVLEHVRDVTSSLAIVAERLAPGGMLYVAVPDVVGLPGTHNAPFQQFSMEHVNFFSVHSLSRAVGLSGFRVLQSGTFSVEWREGVTEAIAWGLYTLGQAAPDEPDLATRAALVEYITQSGQQEKHILAILQELGNARTPLLVWGAGALTRRLLATSCLCQANIVAFVDSNRNAQGSTLAGKPIIAPEELHSRPECILIGSVAFGREIFRDIRDRLGLPNQVITFF